MASLPEELDPFAELKLDVDTEEVTETAGPPPLPPKLPHRAIAPSDLSGATLFLEGPEPRLPLGASPEEKLEHFRALLKNRDQALGRARAAFNERETELEEAQAALRAEKREVQALSSQVSDLSKRLSDSEAERKDLSRALAEVEAELPSLNEQLQSLRNEKGELERELALSKEALERGDEQISKLAETKAELEGSLQAVQEHYQAELAEHERLQDENAKLLAESARASALEGRLAAESKGWARQQGELRQQLEALSKELETERASGTSSSLRKARDELMVANKKATEAGVLLQAERREKLGLETKLASLQRQLDQRPPPPTPASPSAVDVAEQDRLKSEVASLKKKLVMAENAMEVAASLKAKVARLEALLKGGK